ncbi:Alpha-D-glucose 1-phosphate phosphatase YihX [Eubacterium plexicaudatum ASF492]|uniref:HAD hydrolase, family IA n=1 Tax=Eubacterium plexicaudatum ASF492 TaxID=1235802 RepID=N2BD79_9FIRM|nr:Alpha-D-glucose 1-phosphate phosphatase YihX [Eubacterium plexicaudatum ASF492]
MIKNIILDVGMVLVDFCWADLLRELGMSGDVLEAVADATVRTQDWNEYDRSAKSDVEILACLKANAPAYADRIQLFWEHMDGMIRQYPYAKSWIASLKERGYRVYILSNYARRTYELTKENGLNFLPLTDGAVFSFETGFIKPEKEIYHVIMEQYGLNPKECVFIDDNAANLVYPKEIGWSTIRFCDISQVQQELEALLTTA